MSGWVKIHRKMTEWEWYSHMPTRVLFLHLILTANYSDNRQKGVVVKRGEKLTSYAKLAEETGLSIQQIRGAYLNLFSTREITSKKTNKYTIISITNYEKYQGEQHATQQTSNTQTTRLYNKRNKEGKEKKESLGGFEEFWSAMPKRGKSPNPKSPAKKKYEAAVSQGTSHKKLLSAAKRYRADMKATGKEGTQYTAQAMTWLNQKRWEAYDEAHVVPNNDQSAERKQNSHILKQLLTEGQTEYA